MPDDHDRNLRNLHDTLKAAADNKSRAIINPREAREGAEAIERVMEKAGSSVTDATAFMHHLWREASKIEPPRYLPVEQWVLDMIDEVLAESDATSGDTRQV